MTENKEPRPLVPGTVTYDLTAKSGYLYIRPGTTIARTVQLSPATIVDLDDENRIVGVEAIMSRVDTLSLLDLLTRVRFAEED